MQAGKEKCAAVGNGCGPIRRTGRSRVFVFGNELVEEDRAALDVAQTLEGKLPGVEFVFCKSYDELALHGEEKPLVIMDVVEGIKQPSLLKISDLKASQPYSAHDLDLGFFLKLMKPKNVRIVGIPKGKRPTGELVEKARKLLLKLL